MERRKYDNFPQPPSAQHKQFFPLNLQYVLTFPWKVFQSNFQEEDKLPQYLINACFLEAIKKKSAFAKFSSAFFFFFLLKSQKATGTGFKGNPAPSAGRAALIYICSEPASCLGVPANPVTSNVVGRAIARLQLHPVMALHCADLRRSGS